MLTIALKLVGLIVKDHDACHDEGLKLARVLSCKFVGFGCIRIAISLWGSWWLDKVVGVGCAPWVTMMSCWGTWRSWWTRGTWQVIGESAGRSWRAWRPGGEIRGSTRWSWGWAVWRATWWAVRWASWRFGGPWLIVTI